MTPSIRPARPGDEDALLSLMEPFNRGEGLPWNPERCRHALQELLADPSLGFVLVGELGDLAGYAVVTYNFDLEHGGRDAFLTELYVRPEARRSGWGRALLAEIERLARGRGVCALHLAMLPGNEGARALYRSRGYLVQERVLFTLPLADGPDGAE